jgi:hypothetical protein
MQQTGPVLRSIGSPSSVVGGPPMGGGGGSVCNSSSAWQGGGDGSGSGSRAGSVAGTGNGLNRTDSAEIICIDVADVEFGDESVTSGRISALQSDLDMSTSDEDDMTTSSSSSTSSSNELSNNRTYEALSPSNGGNIGESSGNTHKGWTNQRHQRKKKTSKAKLSLRESLAALYQSVPLCCAAVLVASYGISITLVEVTWKGQVKHAFAEVRKRNENIYWAWCGMCVCVPDCRAFTRESLLWAVNSCRLCVRASRVMCACCEWRAV